MRHIYRVAPLSGLSGIWRLMRDDKLHSTYTSLAMAREGMVKEQARDEQSAINFAVNAEVKSNRLAVVCAERDIEERIAALQNWFGIYENQDDSITRRVARNSAYRAAESLFTYIKDDIDLYARAYAARKGEL